MATFKLTNGTKVKLSYASMCAIKNIKRGCGVDFGIHGQSAYGGLELTVQSLVRKKLVKHNGNEWILTDEGNKIAERINDAKKSH